MKKNTCELTAKEINFAVAYIDNVEVDIDGSIFDEYMYQSGVWNPCFDWSQGGRIIERERIHLEPFGSSKYPEKSWLAVAYNRHVNDLEASALGKTALIAAMRCYVASKLGSEVDMQEIFRDLQIEVEVQDKSNT